MALGFLGVCIEAYKQVGCLTTIKSKGKCSVKSKTMEKCTGKDKDKAKSKGTDKVINKITENVKGKGEVTGKELI